MRVSLSWLRELVATDLPADELAERLTMAGVEVETVEPTGYLHPDVRVGRVLAVEPAPGRSDVRRVTVGLGDGREVTVASGAPNLGPGDIGARVALALPGAVVFDPRGEPPRPRPVKAAKIHGIESAGVLCSARELGLGPDHSGVLFLPAAAAEGATVADVVEPGEGAFADIALTLAILPNIARCQSMIGVAREVAALTGGELRLDLPVAEIAFASSDLDPVADDPAKCDQFRTALLEGVRVGPSPEWVQRRLIASGMEPINNVVDASNYVMLELGEPTHAYDADRLPSLKLGVRDAREGEVFRPLVPPPDGPEMTLPAGVLLVTSGDEPVALAGVMGGYDSRVQDDTTRVLLEAAHFDFITVRRSQTAVNLFTESSSRFSRGVDPALPERAAARFVHILKQTCPDLRVVRTGVWTTGEPPVREIDLDVGRMNASLGTALSVEHTVALLEKVGIGAESDGDRIRARVTSARGDVTLPADLMEEVVRLSGYDVLPATMPVEPLSMYVPDPGLEIRTRAIDALVAEGLQEVLLYSMSTPEAEAALHPGAAPDVSYVRIRNPISADRTVMRRTLLPGLLQVTEPNLRHARACHVFTLAPVFLPELGDPETGLPAEPLRLGIVMAGEAEPASLYRNAARPVDFHDLSGVVRRVFDALGIDGVRFDADDRAPYHPGICARVSRGGRVYGHCGALHPKVARAFDLEGLPVLAAELDVAALVADARLHRVVASPPRFPGIELDIAVLVDADLPVRRLMELTAEAGGALVEDVTVFDLYQGEQVPAGQKAVGLRFVLRAADRTLTMPEATEIRDAVAARLERDAGATLRM